MQCQPQKTSESFDEGSLEGQIHFFGFGLIGILFALSAAGLWAGVLAAVEGQLLFFGIGLLVVLFAVSAAVRRAGVLTAVACKAKLFSSILACLLSSFISCKTVDGSLDEGNLEGQILFCSVLVCLLSFFAMSRAVL